MAEPDQPSGTADTVVAGLADTIGPATTVDASSAAASSSPEDPEWGEALVGKLVSDRYDVIRFLGSGGIGAVYLARDRALDELVALKLLNPAYAASPSFTDMLQREVKLARRVTHRNVARTFDFAQHDGRPFLTMEYIEGAPLSRLIATGGALAPDRAIPIIVAVCAGLQAAHDAGIVHRDIKPDNIMIARSGRVAVTDFGLARGARDHAAGPGHFSGTPRYMSPEQVEGRAASIRSDLFSLGVVAYELLSGTLPWRGTTPRDEAEARLRDDPTPLVQIVPQLAAALSDVVMRAMARSQASRFPTAALLSEALLDAVPDARAASPLVPSTSLMGLRSRSPDQRPTVAVLPFENRGDQGDAHLARGFSEDLIDSLSELSQLRVLSLGASARVLEDVKDAREPHEIGQQLGVDLIIAGWVQRADDDVSLRVRAIDVHDGYQRWSQRYHVPLNELLTVSANVARELSVGSLEQSSSRQDPMPTSDALDLYLRAREAYRFPARAYEAVDLFTGALRHAPNSPLINAGLSIALLRQWMMLVRDPGSLAHRAIQAAQRAIDVAPQLGEPYLAQGLVSLHQGDIVGAVRGLRDAITRAPSLADAHGQLGGMLTEMGRIDEGRKRLEAAKRLDPTTLGFLVEARRDLLLKGDWGEAGDTIDQVELSDHPLIAQMQFVRFAAYRNRIDEIRRIKESMRSQPADPFGVDKVVIGLAEFYLGEVPFQASYDALTSGVGASGVSARRYCFAMQLKAEVAGFAGRPELAHEAIEFADKRSLIDLLWLDHCPLLSDVRADPRYVPLRERVAERVNAAYDALWS